MAHEGSEGEVLPEGHKSELGHPHTTEPFKGFIKMKGQTRLKPIQKIQTRTRISN